MAVEIFLLLNLLASESTYAGIPGARGKSEGGQIHVEKKQNSQFENINDFSISIIRTGLA